MSQWVNVMRSVVSFQFVPQFYRFSLCRVTKFLMFIESDHCVQTFIQNSTHPHNGNQNVVIWNALFFNSIFIASNNFSIIFQVGRGFLPPRNFSGFLSSQWESEIQSSKSNTRHEIWIKNTLLTGAYLLS